MTIDILGNAAALIKEGKKTEARRLLEPFIEANLHNIYAWLLEVETQPSAVAKKKVLEVCLRYNPHAPQVQQALAKLEATMSPLPSPPVPKQPPEQGASPKTSIPPQRVVRSKTNRIRIILGVALFVAVCFLAGVYLSKPNCLIPLDAGPCTRILFIGNSYTYVNDLPAMFAELARAGGHKVVTGMVAEGGWTLANHVQSSETLGKLKSSKWDFVVLQEQSEIPASEQSRTDSMYPAARVLVWQVESVSAIPLFFQTWAHRDGWPENGLPDYKSMQVQIDQGYQGISQELHVGIAPVGYAWSIVRGVDPEMDLWQDDGSHPTEQGTYLAACVFYAAIFRQSPEGLTFLGQLPNETAQELQMIAASAVLHDPKQWNLP